MLSAHELTPGTKKPDVEIFKGGMLSFVKTCSFSPPIFPQLYSKPAPTINRSRKSGVPFVPLHNAQPLGMSPKWPTYGRIVPTGKVLLPCEAGNSKFVCEGDAT